MNEFTSYQNQQFLIDAEFKELIPPLSRDEFKQLEENCLKEGIRDALIVWRRPEGGDVLIDGHNRYKIAQENDLEYRTESREFEDRTDAKLWILRNQLGRRNLNTYNRSVLALQLEPLIAEKARKNLRQGHEPLENSTKAVDTREEIAKLANVSGNTIARVKTLEAKASPETKQELKAGTTSVNKAYTDLKKVEAIENSGNEFLKQQVRDGKTTIDQAYRVVTDTADRSPARAKKEFLDGIKKEREEFKEKKADSIVSVTDAITDSNNLNILARDMYVKIIQAGKRIDDLFFDLRNDGLDMKELSSAWTNEDIEKIISYIDEWIRKLSQIRSVITV